MVRWRIIQYENIHTTNSCKKAATVKWKQLWLRALYSSYRESAIIFILLKAFFDFHFKAIGEKKIVLNTGNFGPFKHNRIDNDGSSWWTTYIG